LNWCIINKEIENSITAIYRQMFHLDCLPGSWTRTRLRLLGTDVCFSSWFLADRTNGRAIGTVLRLSVCRLW